MERIKVQYLAGESRQHPGKAVDYMLAEVDGIKLYAEAEPQDDETGTYDELREEIIKQAKANNINPTKLNFGVDPAAYDAGSYGHLVHYDQGFWQINTEAEDEDWTEVLGTADAVESMGPLMGWGEYTSAWAITVNGARLYYFVR